MPDFPTGWTRTRPRAMLTTRIKEEYAEGLESLFQELRADPRFAGLQKYDIVEYLLTPLLTKEGRQQVREDLEGK